MTDRATLLALAERCEQATGPDRKLDGDIFVALHPKFGASPWWRDVNDEGIFHNDTGWQYDVTVKAPHLTGSIDAAMTLVASDSDVKIYRADGRCFVDVYPHGGEQWESSGAITLPLALDGAALRALAETAT